jgi:hypothetical protein
MVGTRCLPFCRLDTHAALVTRKLQGINKKNQPRLQTRNPHTHQPHPQHPVLRDRDVSHCSQYTLPVLRE